jgi:hypothetical protein
MSRAAPMDEIRCVACLTVPDEGSTFNLGGNFNVILDNLGNIKHGNLSVITADIQMDASACRPVK